MTNKKIFNKMHKIALTGMICLVLAGCSSNKEEVSEKPASELFANAQAALQEGDYRQAIKQLEALDTQYPFGEYSQQTQIDLVYSYYKSGEYPLALAAAERFEKLNPTHERLDYVIYLQGLTNMALDDNTLQRWLWVDRSDRDPKHAKNAFKDFNRLVYDFPESEYAADGYKRQVALKERLAKYDLSIVQYYHKRGAYVAVVNRVEQMLIDFPDSQATKEALELLFNAYTELNLPEQASKAAMLRDANPL
ncbi:outer membrane protein assembly factor BamD [Thorsellia kenyensis]|uniref:Outer membrane protein assembly factor BamD n=1 Tax=Thorsellia kenyensis TaxID=1549888 RepID=A0ABV6C8M2_9GAMM